MNTPPDAIFSSPSRSGTKRALRIGEAVNPSHYRYWHPTGTAATFGAAVAAAHLLRLNPAQMSDALGTAGTQAAGLWEFNTDGAMSKHLHPGKAAMNGVLAADLARAGFTGTSRILEGDRGFFRAMSESHDASRITDRLGSHWKIAENCYKLYACCAHTHTAIDAALERRSAALGKIAAVRIATYGPGYEIVREPNPRTPYRAKFSLAYCVAAALVEGRVGLAQFSPDRFDSKGVRDPHHRVAPAPHQRNRRRRADGALSRRVARTRLDRSARWDGTARLGRLPARQSGKSGRDPRARRKVRGTRRRAFRCGRCGARDRSAGSTSRRGRHGYGIL